MRIVASSGSALMGVAATLLLAGVFVAEAQETSRVRGTLIAVEGDALTVNTGDGKRVDLTLKEDAGVFAVAPAAFEDVKEGQFIGITSIESGGKRIALEAHLFTEDLRGIGEGHYPWDLLNEPNMMTNANIAQVKEVGDERELVLIYKEGEGEQKTEGTQTIFLPRMVPVVLVQKGERDLLESGVAVMLIVEDGAAVAAVVGTDGATPPM